MKSSGTLKPETHETITKNHAKDVTNSSTIAEKTGSGNKKQEKICCICLQPDAWRDNPLIKCVKCGMSVHLTCYGISPISISASSWQCSPCNAGESYPSCCLCPYKGGAYKPTSTRGNWCHIICALWIPEVTFGDSEKLEPVILDRLNPQRKGLICLICKKKGYCIQCDKGKCAVSYHPWCALHDKEKRIYLGAIPVTTPEVREEALKYVSFCPTHLKQAQKNGELPASFQSPRRSLCQYPLGSPSGSEHSESYGKGIEGLHAQTETDTPSISNGTLLTTARQNGTICFSGRIGRDEDTSSLLFGRWPGKDSGVPMDSSFFWSTITMAYFSSRLSEHSERLLASVLSDPDNGSDIREVELLGNHGSSSLKQAIRVLMSHSGRAVMAQYMGETSRENGKGCRPDTRALNLSSFQDVQIKRGTGSSEIELERQEELARLSRFIMEHGPQVEDLKRQLDEQRTEDNCCLESWKEEEKRYIEFSNWLEVSKAMLRGIADKSPDFNKPPEPKIPPSWKLAVEGRPAPLDLAQNKTEPEEDEDAVCCVCFDGHSDDDNSIVFCDRCDMPVHQKCYGLREIPDGDFYCDACLYATESLATNAAKCCLCPNYHGALKRTTDGRWAHLACAIWSPGCYIQDLSVMSPVQIQPDDLTQRMLVLASNGTFNSTEELDFEVQAGLTRGGLCSICKQECGVTVRCCADGCQGLVMTVEAKANKISYCGGGSGLVFSLFCESHSSEFFPTRNRGLQTQIRNRYRLRPSSPRKGHKNRANHQELMGRGLNIKNLPPDIYESGRCAVCFQSTSGTTGDAQGLVDGKLWCKTCHIYVHPACYGVEPVIDGSAWECDKCVVVPITEPLVSCLLCPRLGGAYKQTTDIMKTKWVHLFCANNINGCTFDPVKKGPVDVHNVSPDRKLCYLCSRKKGSCVECGEQSCRRTFHPLCGRIQNCLTVLEDDGSRRHYCTDHAPPGWTLNSETKEWEQPAEILKSVLKLRMSLDRTRLLCDLVHAREKKKKLALRAEESLFDYVVVNYLQQHKSELMRYCVHDFAGKGALLDTMGKDEPRETFEDQVANLLTIDVNNETLKSPGEAWQRRSRRLGGVEKLSGLEPIHGSKRVVPLNTPKIKFHSKLLDSSGEVAHLHQRTRRGLNKAEEVHDRSIGEPMGKVLRESKAKGQTVAPVALPNKLPFKRARDLPRLHFDCLINRCLPLELFVRDVRYRRQQSLMRARKPSLVDFDRKVSHLLNAIRTERVKHDKQEYFLIEAFEELPDPVKYSSYYTIVKHPLDFNTIYARAQSFVYEDVDQLESDFKLMTANAKLFNAPQSEICRDADKLNRLFDSQIRILFYSTSTSDKTTSAPTRKRRRSSKPSLGGSPSIGAESNEEKSYQEEILRTTPRSLVGRILSVYWPEDDQWYEGEIISYHDKSMEHQIIYHDGEWEFLALQKTKWRFADPTKHFKDRAFSPRASLPNEEDGNAVSIRDEGLAPTLSQTTTDSFVKDLSVWSSTGENELVDEASHSSQASSMKLSGPNALGSQSSSRKRRKVQELVTVPLDTLRRSQRRGKSFGGST